MLSFRLIGCAAIIDTPLRRRHYYAFAIIDYLLLITFSTLASILMPVFARYAFQARAFRYFRFHCFIASIHAIEPFQIR
jgi:hypothetical protein